mgnify:CR=1 FL=1
MSRKKIEGRTTYVYTTTDEGKHIATYTTPEGVTYQSAECRTKISATRSIRRKLEANNVRPPGRGRPQMHGTPAQVYLLAEQMQNLASIRQANLLSAYLRDLEDLARALRTVDESAERAAIQGFKNRWEKYFQISEKKIVK